MAEQNKKARINDNVLSQTPHDVEIISMAEESKYFINK